MSGEKTKQKAELLQIRSRLKESTIFKFVVGARTRRPYLELLERPLPATQAKSYTPN